MEKIIEAHLQPAVVNVLSLLWNTSSFIYTKDGLSEYLDMGSIKYIREHAYNNYFEYFKVKGKKILPQLHTSYNFVVLSYEIGNNTKIDCIYSNSRIQEFTMTVNDVITGLHYKFRKDSLEILEYHQPEIKTHYLFIFDICNVQKSLVLQHVKNKPQGWNHNANYRSIKYHNTVFKEGYLLIPIEGKINLFVKYMENQPCSLNDIDIQRMIFIMERLFKNPEDSILNEVINSNLARKKIRYG